MDAHPTDDFPRLLAKLGSLINVPTKVSVTSENAWKNHGQLLVIKAYCHLKSIAVLAGSSAEQNPANTSFIDHGSIAVVARAAYETYVLFNFIFLEEDPELRQFRHQVWRLSGLMSRMKLSRPQGLPPERIEQIECESAEINRLRPIIEGSRFFGMLSSHAQKNVRQGDGVRLGQALIDLAESAGLPRKYVADMYNHFCNYSHAGAISAFQLSDTLKDGTSLIMARVTVAFCCILLTQMILAYAKFFDEVNAAVMTDDELLELLGLWKGMSAAFAEMYSSGQGGF